MNPIKFSLRKLGLHLLRVALVSAIVTPAWSAEASPPAKKTDNHGLPAGVADLRIGDAAPDFSLPGIDGKTHTLAEYKESKLLMVAFLSNHCPDSHASLPRIKKFADEMKGKSFTLIAINPNNPDGLNLDELGYTKYNDGFDEMKKYAADVGMNFPYLYDGETQKVAKAYGCLATPHVFLFDADRKLRYKGQFDDSRYPDPATVKSQDGRSAVEALLAGKPVPVDVTKPHGCSTKWMEKKTSVAKADEKWARTPVDLEALDVEGAAKLRKNGTNKVRLINVWATWCAPCVKEFPDLVRASRQFSRRDFELITISVDDQKSTAKAKEFLEKQAAGMPEKVRASVKEEGRTTNSYQFTGANLNGLMQVLDADWPGGVPHSILVAPDGKILWRHNGVLDGDELRAKVVEVLGEYYKP